MHQTAEPIQLFPSTSDPTGLVNGMLWLNNTSGKLRKRESGATSVLDTAIYNVDAASKVLRCPCHISTTQIASSDRAYFCYLGYRPAGEIIQYVRVGVSTVGAGTQVAEVAVLTSTTAPTGSNITLTKLWADGTLANMILTTGRKGNSSANVVALASDSHVWVGFRAAFTDTPTQPTLHILNRDWGDGLLAQTVTAGALTGAGPWTAVPVTFANSTSPDIRGYL